MSTIVRTLAGGCGGMGVDGSFKGGDGTRLVGRKIAREPRYGHENLPEPYRPTARPNNRNRW